MLIMRRKEIPSVALEVHRPQMDSGSGPASCWPIVLKPSNRNDEILGMVLTICQVKAFSASQGCVNKLYLEYVFLTFVWSQKKLLDSSVWKKELITTFLVCIYPFHYRMTNRKRSNTANQQWALSKHFSQLAIFAYSHCNNPRNEWDWQSDGLNWLGSGP